MKSLREILDSFSSFLVYQYVNNRKKRYLFQSKKIPGGKNLKNILKETVMGLAQSLIIGIIIGILFCLSFYAFYNKGYKNKPMGVLKINTSDPDGPYIFLELNKELNEVAKHRIITLVVNLNNNFSRN